jgi:hypothetical protein
MTTPPATINKPAVAGLTPKPADRSFSMPAGSRMPVPMMKLPAKSAHSAWVVPARLASGLSSVIPDYGRSFGRLPIA